jgi:polysaccharide biosynthesis protein PslH
MAEKILIISPVQIIPGYAGNKIRIKKICSLLMDLGYELDFYCTGFPKKMDSGHLSFFNGNVFESDISSYHFDEPVNLRFREIWNGLKIKKEKIKRFFLDGTGSARYNQSLFNYQNIKKIELLKHQITGIRYKAVIVNYAVFSFYFDLFSEETTKILDIHDCLSDRFRLFTERGEKPVAWYSLRPDDDTKAADKAGIIWAITEGERDYYRSLTKHPKVFTLRHLEEFHAIPAVTKNKTVLMIGSENKLNLDGLKWFLTNVWPGVLDQIKESKLIVAGSICRKEGLFSGENVVFFGSYENDEEIYSQAAICINPMQAGTGLKIKTLEALARDKVVVSTTAGASGLDDLAGRGLICHDNPEMWIRVLCSLLLDPDKITRAKKGLDEAISKIYTRNVSVIKESISHNLKF